MATRGNQITQVIKAKGDGSVEAMEIAEYNNDVYVTYQFLALYFGIGLSAVKKWVSINGLEKSTDIGTPQVPLFKLRDVIVWHKVNIAPAINSKNNRPDNDDIDDDDMSYLEGFDELSKLDQKIFLKSTKDPIDRVKAMGDITLNKIKIDKEKGKLIDREEVSITISEYVGIFMSQLKADLKILPTELQSKTPSQISDFIEPHFRSTLEILKKVFVQNVNGEPRVADLFTSLGFLIKEYSIPELNTSLLKLIDTPKKPTPKKRVPKKKVTRKKVTKKPVEKKQV